MSDEDEEAAVEQLEDLANACSLLRRFCAAAPSLTGGKPSPAHPSLPDDDDDDGDEAAAAATAADPSPPSPETAGCALWDLAASHDGAAAVLAALKAAPGLIVEVLRERLAAIASSEAAEIQEQQQEQQQQEQQQQQQQQKQEPQQQKHEVPTARRTAEIALGMLANIYSHSELAGSLAECQRGDAGNAPTPAAAAGPLAGLPGIVAVGALGAADDALIMAEACRLCAAALALGGGCARAWLPELSDSAVLARLLGVVAWTEAPPPLAERCLALLAALVREGGSDGGAGSSNSSSVVATLLELGLLDACDARLSSIAAGLDAPRHRDDGGGWSEGSNGSNSDGGAKPAAPRFAEGVAIAAVELLIATAEAPEGLSELSEQQQQQQQQEPEQQPVASVCDALLALVSAAAATDAGGARLRELLLVAAALVPGAAARLCAQPATYAVAAAQLLAEVPPGSADDEDGADDAAADACGAGWYLLGEAARLSYAKGDEGGGGEEGEDAAAAAAAAAAWRQVYALLERCRPARDGAAGALLERVRPRLTARKTTQEDA